MAAPAVFSADFDFDTDGPWVNVDIMNLADYGDATYLDYLGRGYVAMLDALKTEGLILDYGVMMRTTGDDTDGDVVVWWSIKTLAAYEKAFERMGILPVSSTPRGVGRDLVRAPEDAGHQEHQSLPTGAVDCC